MKEDRHIYFSYYHGNLQLVPQADWEQEWLRWWKEVSRNQEE